MSRADHPLAIEDPAFQARVARFFGLGEAESELCHGLLDPALAVEALGQPVAAGGLGTRVLHPNAYIQRLLAARDRVSEPARQLSLE